MPEEIQVKKNQVPEVLYHMVPNDLFLKFTQKDGTYNCRNQNEWGHASPFIHTTTTLQILKNRVAGNWKDYPLDKKFVLLTIDVSKLDSKFTFAEYNGIKYFHIWGSLPPESFSVSEADRNPDGSFALS